MVKYILLGITQGLTEFLPVSSTAHLLFMQKILGLSGDEIVISAILHLGTTAALVVFFFKDISKALSNLRFVGLVAVVTFITGIIGFSGKDFFESIFASVNMVSLALIFTGVVLILTTKFMHSKRKNVDFKDAIILGLAQAVSIIPGISRSGLTISTLLFLRIERDTCFYFSFIASIPAVLGVNLLKSNEIMHAFKEHPSELFTGFLFSFLSGLIALWLLKLILHKAKLYYFGYYCILVALLTLLFLK